MNYKNSYKKIIWDGIILLSPFLILIFYKISTLFHLPSICLWKMLTGKECIGCGMMRAIVSILKLDFNGAYNYNPLSFVVFPLLLYVWGKEIYKAMRHIHLPKQGED